jgi:ribosomal protein S18 acetylase RimI-like enzyme
MPHNRCVVSSGERGVIRDAVPEDCAAIAVIGAEAFRTLHHDWFDRATIKAIVEQIYSRDSLVACGERCAAAPDAHFLVADLGGEVAGFLHYDCHGLEPELHRIYVDPLRKRAGIGGALMRELHERIPPGGSYILLVAAANDPAIAFYRKHGLHERARVDGLEFYRDHMGVDLPPNPPRVPALVLEYTDPLNINRGL